MLYVHMRIHFVCTGNTYRSRLAEAYLNAKRLSDIHTSSSGIEAAENICGPVCWEAQRILEAEGLVPYMSPMWQQMHKDILDKQNLIIFMEHHHYKYASKQCGFTGDNYTVWDIPDLDELETLELGETIEKVQASEKTFAQIKEKVDELIETLNKQKDKAKKYLK